MKVLKKFYDPLLKRHVFPGEDIEISKENYESYKQYVEPKQPETKTKEEIIEPTFKFIEKPNKKKSGEK